MLLMLSLKIKIRISLFRTKINKFGDNEIL